MAVAFNISDGEEEEIQRKVLESFRLKLTPSAMSSLEYQVKEYCILASSSSQNIQGRSSSTVQRIPFDDLVMRESIGRVSL
mmetsp:Transcript_42870/g.71345  ORF Transcript_42870/g.71345 Transcript_42870/m.71345 type:complete len:81 (-) Transcript_42870:2-244(-)